MFDEHLCQLVEAFAAGQARCENDWYGPWTTILTDIFPSKEGFVVTPDKFPDFVFEVRRFVKGAVQTSFGTRVQLRIVIVVKVNKDGEWTEKGKERLKFQLEERTKEALLETAVERVYWIGAVGSHWHYGLREQEGDELQELVEWIDPCCSIESFEALQNLKALVLQM